MTKFAGAGHLNIKKVVVYGEEYKGDAVWIKCDAVYGLNRGWNCVF